MIRTLFITIILQLSLCAHTLLLNTIDNEDGTMEIAGVFSTGATAEGATIKLISLATSKVIYEDRIPPSGSLIVKVPSEAYKILLDSGPGHKVEKKGLISPKNGFKEVKYKKINIAFYTTLGLSIFFIISGFLLYFIKVKKMAKI